MTDEEKLLEKRARELEKQARKLQEQVDKGGPVQSHYRHHPRRSSIRSIPASGPMANPCPSRWCAT